MAVRDTDIVADVHEARKLCIGKGWNIVKGRVMRRDRSKGCARCGHPIRWDLSGNHPQGPTIDHMGVQVADVVGMARADARRALHNMAQLAVSHRECNTRDGRGIQRPPGAAVPVGYAPSVPTTIRTASRDW